MNEHPILVPQLYKFASKIYRQVKDEGAGLKSLLYNTNYPNKKGIYAIVQTTLQKDTHIDLLLEKSQFLTKESLVPPALARVLIAELIWGKQRLVSDCKPVKSVLAYEQIFQKHCSDLNLDDEPLKNIKVHKPRYVRVNTLKLPVKEAIEAFQDEGWILKQFWGDTYKKFIEEMNSLGESEFMVDIHVKDLLIFPPNTVFFNHNAYKSGEIILQDKASCLPPILLNPPPGSKVLDMCAAPGMKTTQMAALMNNEGTIFAVDKDYKRMEILKTMVKSHGATCVKTIFRDALTVDCKAVPNIEYILIDPSCSGVGMTDRGKSEKDEISEMRLKKLSGFQILILKHALRSFPKAKRIVYSTCSMFPQENEAVVADVLSSNPNFKLLNVKELLNLWDNYGSDEYEVGKYCLYAKPEYDLTNGFFVAVFERLQKGEVNEFLMKDYKQKNVGIEFDGNGMEQSHKKGKKTSENQAKQPNVESDKKLIAKKSKKRKLPEEEVKTDKKMVNNEERIEPLKKKKKQNSLTETVVEPIKKKKKKKKQNSMTETVHVEVPVEEMEITMKKKKVSKKSSALEESRKMQCCSDLKIDDKPLKPLKTSQTVNGKKTESTANKSKKLKKVNMNV